MDKPEYIEKIITFFINNKNESVPISHLFVYTKFDIGFSNFLIAVKKYANKSYSEIERYYNDNTGKIEYKLKDKYYKNECRKIKLKRIQ